MGRSIASKYQLVARVSLVFEKIFAIFLADIYIEGVMKASPGKFPVLCVTQNRSRDKMLYFIQFLIASPCSEEAYWKARGKERKSDVKSDTQSFVSP